MKMECLESVAAKFTFQNCLSLTKIGTVETMQALDVTITVQDFCLASMKWCRIDVQGSVPQAVVMGQWPFLVRIYLVRLHKIRKHGR